MRTNYLYQQAYGIFCIAMAMNENERNVRELDSWWDKAIALYDEFINSEFNDSNQSELDCINRFMDNRAK